MTVIEPPPLLQASRLRAPGPASVDRGQPGGGAVSGRGLGCGVHEARH